MNAALANHFHDWVSSKFSFNNDFVVVLELLDKNDKTHIATLTFADYKDLSFTYWTHKKEKLGLVKHTELHNTHLMENTAVNRWLQDVENKSGLTEIQFIGGNNFSESHVVVFAFKHGGLEIKVNGQELKNEEKLSRFLNNLNI